jgi:hypothetical protein
MNGTYMNIRGIQPDEYKQTHNPKQDNVKELIDLTNSSESATLGNVLNKLKEDQLTSICEDLINITRNDPDSKHRTAAYTKLGELYAYFHNRNTEMQSQIRAALDIGIYRESDDTLLLLRVIINKVLVEHLFCYPPIGLHALRSDKHIWKPMKNHFLTNPPSGDSETFRQQIDVIFTKLVGTSIEKAGNPEISTSDHRTNGSFWRDDAVPVLLQRMEEAKEKNLI